MLQICSQSISLLVIFIMLSWLTPAIANPSVFVTRFWHNHQPIYWPEWNSNGPQNQRVQWAWDSILLKERQNYGGISFNHHPENELYNIFGNDDRRAAYQGRPHDAINSLPAEGGMAISYSGSLMDNVAQLGSLNQLGYNPGWNQGNITARHKLTSKGGPRLDLVGFTYHHSLAPLLPKEVFRKEVQIFKQAWKKNWGGAGNFSDHSRGFFPTEMAYTRDLIDVLVDEGYQWVIVASHHLSRTSPSYLQVANPEKNYQIFSSPPNRADLLGPVAHEGWWYDSPNPGNAAWNLAPYAYQLHRIKYINPTTGAEKTMIAVPSDDVLSYQAGYSGAQLNRVSQHIAPYARDPRRPVLVMPATDGDNAWGGGYDSWMISTPSFFHGAKNMGYNATTVEDFVRTYGADAPIAHIEDGAWIYPEMCYGSPYFLKWIEPPLANPNVGANQRYPGTVVDLETPGFALKFFSYAPLMAGANWLITAEQITQAQGGQVRPEVIQDPSAISGGAQGANPVELAWHIYLTGLDSGFNYYGGLGNDDEVKPALATMRALEKLAPYLANKKDLDRTGPTVLRPQRFPYNPGSYTFGWFNHIPGGDGRYLKKMPSEFYIWTLAYDLSQIKSLVLKIRRDKDGIRSLATNHNVTYAGGSDVEEWISIPMQARQLPKTRVALNKAASNGQIDYFVFDEKFWPNPQIADYYFAKITNENFPDFRGHLFDYYIEAVDSKGNYSRSEIQHVWVEDDGQ